MFVTVVVIPDYLIDSITSQIELYISIVKDIKCIKEVFLYYLIIQKEIINKKYSNKKIHFFKFYFSETSKKQI